MARSIASNPTRSAGWEGSIQAGSPGGHISSSSSACAGQASRSVCSRSTDIAAASWPGASRTESEARASVWIDVLWSVGSPEPTEWTVIEGPAQVRS